MNDAIEVCREFVGHYPAGLNKELDAAYVAAREVLKREEELAQPVTEERLLALGATKDGEDTDESFAVYQWEDEHGEVRLGLFRNGDAPDDPWSAMVGHHEDNWPDDIHAMKQVVELLAALGIPVKERA